MKIRLLAFLILLGLGASGALGQSQRVIPVRGGPKINVTVPMGYSYETRANPDGSVTVIMENPIWGIAAEALMKVDLDPGITKPDWQQSKLITFMASILSQANETDYDFKPLAPVRGTGQYAVFSALGLDESSSVPEGGPTHCTVGLKAWPKFVLIFRIWSKGVTSPEYAEIFETFNWSFTP